MRMVKAIPLAGVQERPVFIHTLLAGSQRIPLFLGCSSYIEVSSNISSLRVGFSPIPR